ncbi:MAG: ATP-binding protein [Pseudomonadota bacterium]
MNILRCTLDPGIEVLSKKDAPVSAIAGDSGQIEQALMNLCINAADAMPQGGRLLITTDLVEVDRDYCASRAGLHPGTHLRITVQDTGEGMPKHVLRRVFEPFFTTKGEAQGTGLGLSMVYGTVKSHSGHVDVYSEPGRGTAFKILLPIQGDTPAPTASPHKPEIANGTGTILVVDDEEIIRAVLSDMLREMGYSVLTAVDGQEGLEVYRERRDDIDLVIMDMIMPRLNGKEAFAEMKKINPLLRAILSTGFCHAATAEEAVFDGIIACIQKPFHMEELSRAIAQALRS